MDRALQKAKSGKQSAQAVRGVVRNQKPLSEKQIAERWIGGWSGTFADWSQAEQQRFAEEVSKSHKWHVVTGMNAL